MSKISKKFRDSRKISIFEIGSVVLKKFGFENNASNKTGQLYEQSFSLFLETKFEAKIKLVKPLNCDPSSNLHILPARVSSRVVHILFVIEVEKWVYCKEILSKYCVFITITSCTLISVSIQHSLLTCASLINLCVIYYS